MCCANFCQADIMETDKHNENMPRLRVRNNSTSASAFTYEALGESFNLPEFLLLHL